MQLEALIQVESRCLQSALNTAGFALQPFQSGCYGLRIVSGRHSLYAVVFLPNPVFDWVVLPRMAARSPQYQAIEQIVNSTLRKSNAGFCKSA
jgi:hypothetical protein